MSSVGDIAVCFLGAGQRVEKIHPLAFGDFIFHEIKRVVADRPARVTRDTAVAIHGNRRRIDVIVCIGVDGDVAGGRCGDLKISVVRDMKRLR